MLTFDEFTPRYRRLVKAYGKLESGEQCAAYFEVLKSFPEGVLEQAIAKVIGEEKHFPAAAVIRDAGRGIMAGAVYHAPTCQLCHGDLFVPAAPRVLFQLTYQQVSPCPECKPSGVGAA
jgi:hypothetical protein